MVSVYMFLDDARGVVKIGIATDVRRRLGQVQVGYPWKLGIVRVIDGDRRTERWMHRKYKDRRLNGEWFEWQAEMLDVRPPDFTSPDPSAGPIERFRTVGDALGNARSLGLVSDAELMAMGAGCYQHADELRRYRLQRRNVA